jgi:hypothetical protein
MMEIAPPTEANPGAFKRLARRESNHLTMPLMMTLRVPELNWTLMQILVVLAELH